MTNVKDNSTRAKYAVLSIKITILLFVGLYICTFLLNNALINGDISYFDVYGEGGKYSWILITIGLTVLVVGLPAVIIFTLWLRRSYYNLVKYKSDHRYKVYMTFWGWIIPIGSLWIPYQILVDLWKGFNMLLVRVNSDFANREYSTHRIGVFWGCYLGASFLPDGTHMVSSDFNFLLGLHILSGVLNLVASFYLIDIVQKIADMEAKVFERRELIFNSESMLTGDIMV